MVFVNDKLYYELYNDTNKKDSIFIQKNENMVFQ